MERRRVWTYWNTRPLPADVEESIASWRKHLPDYEIAVLDDRSVAGVAPSTYSQLLPAVKADVVRCHALATHGGIWLDAHVTLQENLDWLLTQGESAALHAFKFAHNPHIENWFLAVHGDEGRLFMRKWKAAFYRLLEHWPNVRGVYGNPCTSDPEYYIMYEAYCYLMRTDPAFRRTNIHLVDARWYMYPPLGWAMPIVGSPLIKYCTVGRWFRTRLRVVPWVLFGVLIVVYFRRLR